MWHIVSLEALLGNDDNKKIKETLKTRISNILSTNANQKKYIEKLFGALYQFRCDLVHGNNTIDSQKPLHIGHLYKARQFSRKLILWFLNYLNHIINLLDELGLETDFLDREILLLFLDKNEKELKNKLKEIKYKEKKKQILIILEKLKLKSKSFPYVRDWNTLF